MILAELEVYHSRPIAPTRRVALGEMNLPVDPPPGFGGVLLGGIVANNVHQIDPDLVPEVHRLMAALDDGQRISQPRLKFRLQHDRVGLQRSRHRLIGQSDTLGFEFDDANGSPVQQLLGAVYATGQLPPVARHAVMGTLRRAITWRGIIGPDLITALAGFSGGHDWSAMALSHPIEWALEILGLGGGPGRADRRAERKKIADPVTAGLTAAAAADGEDGITLGYSKREIQQAYRTSLIEAHPDHGGGADSAAQRIADLGTARRILLG